MDSSAYHDGPLGRFLIPPLKSHAGQHCIECQHVLMDCEEKRNCKNCGHIVCPMCSIDSERIPKFGYHSPVRCCDTCYRLVIMQNQKRSILTYQPSEYLQEYADAYNLPSSDINTNYKLITLILQTPITNELECGYRQRRDELYDQQAYGGICYGTERLLRYIQTSAGRSHLLASASSHTPSDPLVSESSCPCLLAHNYPRLQCPYHYLPSNASIHEMVRHGIDPTLMSVRELENILRDSLVQVSPQWEKRDLVDRVRQLMQADQISVDDQADLQCCICLDSPQNCVLLDCGHMATCIDCGKKLTKSTRKCPVCRASIKKVIRVYRS